MSPCLRRWTVDSSRSCRDTDSYGTVATTIIRIRRGGVGWETLVNRRVSLGVLPPAVIIAVPLCFFLNRSSTCCSYGLCVSPLRFGCDGVSRPYSLLGFLLGFSPVSVRDSLCARMTTRWEFEDWKGGVGGIRWSPLLSWIRNGVYRLCGLWGPPSGFNRNSI